MTTKYPEVTVKLTGTDGNAFSILGKVKKALRLHGVSTTEQTEFWTEATSGDYDNVLMTAMKWVTVE